MTDRVELPGRTTEPDLAILVVGAARAIADRLVGDLGDAGYAMRPAFGYVLRSLHHGPQTLTELAALLDVTKQSVSAVIDEMEQRGLVARDVDPADRRTKRLRLTDDGVAARALALRVSEDIERELAADVGPRAVAAMRKGLLGLLARHDLAEHAAAGRARPVW